MEYTHSPVDGVYSLTSGWSILTHQWMEYIYSHTIIMDGKYILMHSLVDGVYRIRFNFRGVKLSWIANFRVFRIFIFAVCDVIAHALPV